MQVQRLPVVVQNVVTYTAVIDVPSADLRLEPEVIAAVTTDAARADDVIRVPNAGSASGRLTTGSAAGLRVAPAGSGGEPSRR